MTSKDTPPTADISLQGRPYSCQKLIEARELQKALFTYLSSERDIEKETLAEQTLCLCRFLKSYVCILSAAEWTAHCMGDDVCAHRHPADALSISAHHPECSALAPDIATMDAGHD